MIQGPAAASGSLEQVKPGIWRQDCSDSGLARLFSELPQVTPPCAAAHVLMPLMNCRQRPSMNKPTHSYRFCLPLFQPNLCSYSLASQLPISLSLPLVIARCLCYQAVVSGLAARLGSQITGTTKHSGLTYAAERKAVAEAVLGTGQHRELLSSTIGSIVRRSSARQTAYGALAVGASKSARYLAAKLAKAWKPTYL